MLRIHTSLLIFGLAVLTACGGTGVDSGMTDPAKPDPTVSISGTVTFKGVPLAGATVADFLTNENRVYATAVTDAAGHYSFSGIKATGNVPGRYHIYVNQAGYSFYPSVGSGATVTRADYTGQYEGSGLVQPSGLFFTVIDFLAVPDHNIPDADFAAFDGTNPRVSLAATGQQTSYAAGDDGSLKSGVTGNAASRFTDNQDGTITDALTGLIWLKDTACLGNALWADALTKANALASGQCGLSDASKAGDWRLPNIRELESLVDASSANPAIAANPFQNISSGIFWSSTSYYGGVGGSTQAWTIRLSDGRYMNDSSANVKASAGNQVWAVRENGSTGTVQLAATGFYLPYGDGDDGRAQSGVRLPSPRFVDHGDGTIADTMTGLVWLKRADCIRATWSEALAAVNTLASGQCGLTDDSSAGQWRMPNRRELESLADRAQNNQALYFNYTYLNKDGSVYQAPIFTNYIENQYYWTSTTDAADPTEAWTIYSCDFGIYDIPKNTLGYTLAVRQ